MTAVADKLREARALIAKGWTRGENCRGGRVCALGALSAAFKGDPDAPLYGAEYPTVISLLQRATDSGPQFILWAWNDSQPSKKPVLAAFDKAIELAESGQ